ncbi:MAG: PocR ligand-binding domain-containing protein [Clostridiales Family XIII bacterium]|nr:PocR ligand-binding domain-containing protein [Clostridiales Family XIII bacterium]
MRENDTMDAVQRLKGIINIEKWQLLQNALSDVTGMSIITADYRGVPITEHSGCRVFCRTVRDDPELTRLCQKCDSRGGLEAIRAKAPYIYRCHFGILDAAIPIIIDNSYLGSILIGQVTLSDPASADRLEMICPETALPSDPCGRIKASWERIPVFSLARVEVVVNMLFHLCNYFVSEALEKKTILRLLSDIGAAGLTGGDSHADGPTGEVKGNAAATADASGLESIRKNLNSLITDARASEAPPQSEDEDLLSNNKMLKRVFSYMNAHRSERLSLNEMARLCHISPSYFSRLFHKETGENYSAFLLRKRVEWGKALLSSTDMKLAQIAEESGFSDAGHFVRSFKKHEGVTPSLFRTMVVGTGAAAGGGAREDDAFAG